MGISDLPFQIADRFLDTLKNSGQRLNGGLGGVWQRRVYFGQLEQFVDAARTIGASSGRIVFRHLVPNVLGIVIVYLTLTIPSVAPAVTSVRWCMPR